MAIAINDTNPVVSYIATQGQTNFGVPYPFFANADLKVTRAGVLLTYAPTPANANQYSVTGANTPNGGSITLGSPGANAGDKIVIYGDMPIERFTNHPETGPFDIKSLNTEQAKQTAMMKQLRARLRECLKAPIGEQPSNIPDANTRANKYLKFDANGNPIAMDVMTLVDAIVELVSTAYNPIYASIAAGLAGTSHNQEFAVDNNNGSVSIYLNNAGTAVFRRTVIIDPSSSTTASLLGAAGGVTVQDALNKRPVTTVANLPAASTANQGREFYVTDANSTTRLAVVAGGGSNFVKVFCTGSQWLIG